MHLRQLLAEIAPELAQEGPTVVYCDSSGAIRNSQNPCFKKKLAHMKAKFQYARECSDRKEVKLVKCATKDNRADPFTKNLGPTDFKRHMDMIMRPVPECFKQ